MLEMKDIIVFDEDENKFVELEEYCADDGFLDEDSPINEKVSSFLEHYFGCETFLPLGLKDINDKKIYADSSIVKFKWVEEYIGYFTYNTDSVRYEIIILKRPTEIKGAMFNTFDYDQYAMKDFKVIDTIQENKLGLLKWMSLESLRFV